MILHYSYPTCKSSEPYLYYFLMDDLNQIPEDIADHIRHCPSCQSVMDQLKSLHFEPDEANINRDHINTALSLHFACTSKAVDCKTVKPFLPSLLIDQMVMDIPTPITTHIRHCPACSDDLRRLSKLILTPTQLARLARFYAATLVEDAKRCSETNTVISSIAEMNYHHISSAVLSHVCICPTCKESVNQKRIEMHQTALKHIPKSNFPCDDVTSADLFDYVIPYGFDPAGDDKATFRESLVSHLRDCPECLKNMQHLNNILYSIADHDSGVITRYELKPSHQESRSRTSDDIYEDWPVQISIEDNQSKDSASSRISPFFLSRTIGHLKLKRYLQPAAAAMVLLVFALLFYPSSARGIELRDIYHAVAKIKNVYIARYIPNQSAPISELWYSKPDMIRLFRDKKETILWDIPHQVIKIKKADSAFVTSQQVHADNVLKMVRNIEYTTGLLPFENYRDIPSDAEWIPIAEEHIKSIVPGSVVYELQWRENTPATTILITKIRCYIDPGTHIIQRLERYQKDDFNADFTLTYITLIRRLSNQEWQAVIQAAFD